jgi:hypothetical protein
MFWRAPIYRNPINKSKFIHPHKEKKKSHKFNKIHGAEREPIYNMTTKKHNFEANPHANTLQVNQNRNTHPRKPQKRAYLSGSHQKPQNPRSPSRKKTSLRRREREDGG